MKFFLRIVIASLISGVFVGGFSQIIGVDRPSDYWFYVGACLCFFSVGYVEGLSAFKDWWTSQPKFRGFRYWIRKAFNLEVTK